jgi:hypothetical protein
MEVPTPEDMEAVYLLANEECGVRSVE